MLIWSQSEHLVSMAVIAMAIGFGAFGNNEINMCIGICIVASINP